MSDSTELNSQRLCIFEYSMLNNRVRSLNTLYEILILGSVFLSGVYH